MFRKALHLWGDHPFKVFFAVALAGTAYLTAIAYGFGAPEKQSGKFVALEQPRSGSIEAPQPPGIGRTMELASGGDRNRVKNCDHLLLEANAEHVLREDYVPAELVYLASYGVATREAEDMLRPGAA